MEPPVQGRMNPHLRHGQESSTATCGDNVQVRALPHSDQREFWSVYLAPKQPSARRASSQPHLSSSLSHSLHRAFQATASFLSSKTPQKRPMLFPWGSPGAAEGCSLWDYNGQMHQTKHLFFKLSGDRCSVNGVVALAEHRRSAL